MEDKEYNEDDAIQYILRNLPQEVAQQYNDDDILLVIDSIFDFYDERGFFNLDFEGDDIDFDEVELVEYVKKALKKDKDNRVKIGDVANIVHLELEYEDTLSEI